MSAAEKTAAITIQSPNAYLNRELSWLNFARRVLALVEDLELPLLERLKFAGIVGMLHDEFFMKRMSGLKRMVKRGVEKPSMDGRKPSEEMEACRKEILSQISALSRAIKEEIRPGLKKAGIPILDYADLDKRQKEYLHEYFHSSVQPILTPLAVDAEHPFPFISNHGVNLAVQVPDKKKGAQTLRAHQGAEQSAALDSFAGQGRLRAVGAGHRRQSRSTFSQLRFDQNVLVSRDARGRGRRGGVFGLCR